MRYLHLGANGKKLINRSLLEVEINVVISGHAIGNAATVSRSLLLGKYTQTCAMLGTCHYQGARGERPLQAGQAKKERVLFKTSSSLREHRDRSLETRALEWPSSFRRQKESTCSPFSFQGPRHSPVKGDVHDIATKRCKCEPSLNQAWRSLDVMSWSSRRCEII